MRYDDASGAFQASGPVANDDADTLAAGQKSATGNVITGEGTQYGASGADSAAGAHITAIAGKGGEDSSFSGGKLSVEGEHGRLTVDADGNYSYMAKGEVENVRDRFTYTLADGEGNSDTAALIVEIGKTPAVIKADAQQIVVGPDGVVTLPPGVELSDVHVVGRNLVVDMPDGTQLVIIDGAVFVPQLQLGGVEVPATNVAALLIGQEVQPAAGELPPSSGGNFALPPPPLDPGIPLGDLIPPTELDYVPPEPDETFLPLDEEPEIFIQPDGQPASVNAVDSVDEKGLPTRNGGEPEGSGEEAAAGADGDTSEATAGTIIIDSPDGVGSVTINGVLVTGAIGQEIEGEFGILTITGFSGDNILYDYLLTDNTSGNNTHDDFSVTLTDEDGDQATATLVINIIDDVPTARPDTDVVPAGEYGPVTGNVITDASAGDADDGDNGRDTVGADDAELTNVTGFGDSDPGEGGWVVQGQYGVLTISNDGSYSYTRDPGTPGGVEDVFNYTLTDGDGDTSTTTLTITIEDAEPETRPNPVVRTDDDAVPGADGIPGGPEDNVDAENLTGTLLGVGGDGPLSFDLLTTGAPAGFTYVDGPDGSVLVQQVQDGSTVTVLTVTIDADTGDYTVTQNAPILHPTLNGQAGDDTENNVSFTINYNVEDQDGDAAAGTLVINVDDDSPEMNRADVSLPTLHVDETNLAANDSADYSVVFAGAFGADGPGDTSYAVSVVNGTDSGLVDVDTGDAILLFNNNGVVEGRVGGEGGAVAFTVSVNSDSGVVTLDQVRALVHPDNPDNDESVSAVADSIQLTASITDADGDSDSLTVNIGHTLVFDDDGPSVNPTLNADATVEVDESLPSGTPGIDTGGFAPGDDPDLEGGLALGQANSGEAIVDANAVFGADGPADSDSLVYALSITNPDPGVTLTDGTSITMQLVGGVIVGVVDSGTFAGQAAFAIAIDPASGVVTVEQYLSLDHPLNPNQNEPIGLGDNSVGVTVTATDGDGDPVTSDEVDISGQITFRDDGPSVNPTLNADATVVVDESLPSNTPGIDTGDIDKGDDPDLEGGLALGQANSGEAIVDANAVFGADGPAAGGGISYALSITNPDPGVTLTDGTSITMQLVGGVIVGVVDSGTFAGQAAFAIAIDPASGVVTVEQYLSLDHPLNPNQNEPIGLGDNSVGVTVTATDGDGDPVTSDEVDISGQITFRDDGPSADAVLQENATAVLDESPPSTAPVIDTPGVTKGNDPDLGGGTAIGFDTTGSAVIDPNAFFGADGPAAGGGIDYALSIINAPSGLSVTDGSPINLQLLANGVVVGVVDGGDFDGQAAFAISIDPDTGVVSVEQYLSLEHPDDTDHNDPLSMDELTVGVTATVTDGDGDSITTGAIDISGQITFLDDGPNAQVNGNATLDTLVLDETTPPGTETDGDSNPAGLVSTTANFADNFITPANHGADGPGTVTYAFVLDGENVASGLYTVDPSDTVADGDGIGQGTEIVLNVSPDGLTVTGSVGADDYFTITIDPETGVVEFTQLDNIWHGNTGSDDDTSTLTAAVGALLIRQTVTDGDNDVDTADVDVSQGVFQIEDDGPVAKNDVDEILSGGETTDGNVITGIGTNGGAANADDVGADSPGRVTGVSSVNEPLNTDQDADPDVFEIDGEFGTLVLNSDGSYTYTRFDGGEGDAQDVFTYTLIDADGDTDTATLTINIGDASPDLPDPPLIRLDDDVIPGADGNVPDGPDDDNPDTVGDNVVNGQLDGTGGDGDLTYNFTGVDTLPTGFSIDPTSTASTLLINQGTTLVMTIVLNNDDGSFTVTQNNPILHPTQDGGANDDTENNLNFSIGVEVEDADHDVEPATITINVDDDTPVLQNVTAGAGVDVDETDFPFPVSDTSADPVIDADTLFGADGPATANSIVYGLSIAGGSPEPSGLQTAVGNHDIDLVQTAPDTIEGQYEDGGTQVAFTILINTDGTVTLTQNVPLEHTEDGGPALHNDTLDLEGLVNATITITDADGDSTSGSAPIGDNLVFFDDGPNSEVDGQVAVPTVTLDETRPVGDDSDSGDDDPAGLDTVTVGFAGNFQTADHGADGAGTVSYALLLAADGDASGMYALQNSDTDDGGDGDGYGQGDEILLFQELDGSVTGRTVDGGDVYFTISVNSDGEVTFEQSLNVWHADSSDDDDSSGLSAAAETLQLQQTVTDSDGDFDTSAIDLSDGVFFIEDDGPVINEVTNATGDNVGPNPSAEGIFDFDIGTDSPNGGHDDISVDPTSVVISINGTPLDPSAITFGESAAGEDEHTAEYEFSFEYATGEGDTDTVNGTLIFYKDGSVAGHDAGTYEIVLDSVISGFSIDDVQSNLDTMADYNDEHIRVITFDEESAPGAEDGFFIQFMGEESATGPEPFGHDDVWTGDETDVHISSTDIGVHGNAVQNDEVLDFEFMSHDPAGTNEVPSASASGAFIHLEQLNGTEDFVITLKLADPSDPANFITRTLVVQASDVITDDALVPDGYPSVNAGSDSGQGIIIIEPNDYIGLPGVDPSFEIVGMQFRSSTSDLDSAAGEIYNFDGDIGEFDHSTTSFTGTTDNDVFKITNIGVVRPSTTDQSVTIDFDVTITDVDGDSQTASISATIGEETQTLAATAQTSLSTTSKVAANDDFSSLLVSDSEHRLGGNSFGNVGNTGITSAMVAASGLAVMSGSLQGFNDPSSSHLVQDDFQSLGVQAVARGVEDSPIAAMSLGGDLGGSHIDAVSLSGSGFNFADHGFGGGSLDSMSFGNAEPAYIPNYASGEPTIANVAAFAANVPTVSMAAAEMLRAANIDGELQQGGGIEQVLADALGGHAPTIDAVLANLPGGNVELAAISHLASGGSAGVPAWDMGMQGGFSPMHDMLFKVAAVAVHHDAVQPA